MEIAKGSLGPETTYDVVVKEGKLLASLSYAGADGAAKLELSFGLESLIDKGAAALKKAIPGQIDDAIIDTGVNALKSVLK